MKTERVFNGYQIGNKNINNIKRWLECEEIGIFYIFVGNVNRRGCFGEYNSVYEN